MSTAAALLAAPLLRRRVAAATATTPKRFVVFQSVFGTHYPAWRPTGGETDFQLSRILAPLEPHRARLNIVDGLDNLGPAADTFDDHAKAFMTQLTASDLVKGADGASQGFANGISIDQLIASRLGDQTRLRSLNLVGWPHDQRQFISYSAPGIPVRPFGYPQEVFAEVFRDLSGDRATLDRLLAQRRSVLDNVHHELTAIGVELGAEGRQTLEAHAQSIREIEQKLDPRLGAGAACMPPVEAELFANIDANMGVIQQNGDTAFLPEMVRINLDLIALAFACDVTRVATINLLAGGTGLRFSWLGAQHGHHENSHCLLAPPGELEANKEEYVRAEEWIAEQFAYLLAKLEAQPEGYGTMLDSSLAMWIHENGDPHSHSQYSIPIVLAGNAGGSVRSGRYLKYTRAAHLQRNGRNTNDLFVSICHAFGLRDVTSFGTPALNRAPLEGLVG